MPVRDRHALGEPMKKPTKATNVARQMKAAYGRTAKPGKPMKTVLKGRMMTRKKP